MENGPNQKIISEWMEEELYRDQFLQYLEINERNKLFDFHTDNSLKGKELESSTMGMNLEDWIRRELSNMWLQTGCLETLVIYMALLSVPDDTSITILINSALYIQNFKQIQNQLRYLTVKG